VSADQLATAPDPAPVLARGLAVFALPAGGRRPAPGWQHRCLTDPAALRQVWTPGDNIGVGCRASNLVGLDLDQHDHGHDRVDGIATFTALRAAADRPWPTTLTVRTPHGQHLYFRAPAGCAIGSASGVLGPGVDVRGPGRRAGGYLIGPGSIVGGTPYTIAVDVEIQPLPTWLADLLGPRSPCSWSAGWVAEIPQ
jgi:hypothetical protein